MSTSLRARRPFWADVRFLIGIVLVITAIAGVWLIVSSSKATTPVLQANRTITPGEALTSDDFLVVDVGLGAAVDDYLAPQDLTAGMVAARTLESGELLPVSATTNDDELRTTTIVVESSIRLSDRITPGTRVEVWQALPDESGRGFLEPSILIADAVVAALPEQEGVMLNDGEGLELVIERSDVANAVAAMSAGAALSVVPLGGGS